MPVAALVHQLVQSLVGRGAGEEDFAALIRMQAQTFFLCTSRPARASFSLACRARLVGPLGPCLRSCREKTETQWLD